MSTTLNPISAAPRSSQRTRGFTLVELLLCTVLMGLVLTGVLSAFLMIGRTGYNASSYSTMEAEARRALETFSIEARMASNAAVHLDAGGIATAVTLTVETGVSGNYTVTYEYFPANKAFYRQLGTGRTVPAGRPLVSDVSSFAFRRFKIQNGVQFETSNDTETKQLQITLRTVRSRTTVVDATNAVLSARVVLRNKPVTT